MKYIKIRNLRNVKNARMQITRNKESPSDNIEMPSSGTSIKFDICFLVLTLSFSNIFMLTSTNRY
jgi:hypothetical protein